MPVERLLYRPVEAAEALGISRSRVYELITSGDIPSIRLAGTLRVPVDGLRRLVKRKLDEWKRRHQRPDEDEE